VLRICYGIVKSKRGDCRGKSARDHERNVFSDHHIRRNYEEHVPEIIVTQEENISSFEKDMGMIGHQRPGIDIRPCFQGNSTPLIQ
jgi:hypothetical protein